MKRGILLVMILALTVGTAWGKNYEVTKKVESYTVKVETDKNPPIAGDNNFSLMIQDASGKNVTDAKVKVEYSMPPMPGMPAANYKTEAVLKGSEYRAKVNFPMAGSWGMTIQIAQGAKVMRVRLNVDVK